MKKSDVTVRQWHYENGALMKEQEYIHDSIEHGTYRYFYPNGILKDSAQITHNKFHGERFEYHKNGELYILTNYINGKYRNATDYRENATLDVYRAYDYHKNLRYIVHYDSLGKPSSYEGNLIFSWVQEGHYPIGKEFNVELLIANPPNCQTEVTVSDWDILERQAISQKNYAPDKFNRVNYSRTQNPDKEQYILHMANVRDTVEQTTLSDTLVIVVDKDGKSSYMRQLPD